MFRKLLLIRAWCPDRTLSQARKYIFDSLGADYLESSVLDIDSMLEESDNRIPLICLLSIGSDPTPQIEAMSSLNHSNTIIFYLISTINIEHKLMYIKIYPLLHSYIYNYFNCHRNGQCKSQRCRRKYIRFFLPFLAVVVRPANGYLLNFEAT